MEQARAVAREGDLSEDESSQPLCEMSPPPRGSSPPCTCGQGTQGDPQTPRSQQV
eukprot:CAMPEP_0117489072 /NCGR_PEP_ID=MMETSP0784-20121206/16844_1 /TAXON_ID=39447 /ORGANISM="" /LENGTH=54 /DNA_ID=CAMNT_0005283783 /DNA_START=1343 /DNA_END=1507 /DNA_ORIENTATION=-